MTEEANQTTNRDCDDQIEKLAHTKVADQILTEMKLASIQETNEICEYKNGVYCQRAKYKILRRIEFLMEGNVTSAVSTEVVYAFFDGL